MEEIREIDDRLHVVIHDTRDRLLKALKPNEQLPIINGADIHINTNIVNGAYLNETIKRQPDNWLSSQRTIIQRNTRWDQPRGEAQRVGGISVGPVRQNDVTYGPPNNVRSR